VNEFGEVGIDGALVVAADGVVELSNGCVCCTTNGDLVDAVLGMLERRDRVDYLVVETTGLADPLPVAQTFLGPGLGESTRLDSILALADAENFAPDLFRGRAARHQLLYADVVLLNKCDLVGEQRLREVESRIRRFKEGVPIIRTTRARVPLPLVLGVGASEPDRHADGPPAPGHDHLAEDGFSSVSFTSDRPLSLDRFQHFLDQLPANVFRAKGVLWVEGVAGRHVFHLTGRRFSLEKGPWAGRPGNRLVLIGRGLDHGRLREQLRACLGGPVEHEGGSDGSG
jgi:G3E family GTPase